MLAGTAKVFIGLGGNFVRAVPDTERAFDAMAKLDLTEMAFKESLRMIPPVPSMPRRAL